MGGFDVCNSSFQSFPNKRIIDKLSLVWRRIVVHKTKFEHAVSRKHPAEGSRTSFLYCCMFGAHTHKKSHLFMEPHMHLGHRKIKSVYSPLIIRDYIMYSRRVIIWREHGARYHPRNAREIEHFGSHEIL